MSEHQELPLVITPSAELSVQLGSMLPEQTHRLLRQEDPEEGIRSIETYARINEREDLPSVFTVTSYIEPTQNQSQQGVTERFVGTLPVDLSGMHAYEINANSDFSAACMSDGDGHHCLVTPLFDKDAWLVQSVLDGFYQESDRPEVMGRVVFSHAVVLNALAATIAGRSYFRVDAPREEGEEIAAHKVFELDMPPMLPPPESDPFANFSGIEHAVGKLRNVARLADADPELLARNDMELIQAVLLSGPTGVGKTELARALGLALRAETLEYGIEDISSMYTGEWAKKIAEIFNEAFAAKHRVLLFLDEFEGLISTGNPGSQSNVYSVLKQKLELIKQHPHVFVVMATNEEGKIPPEVRAQKRIPLTIRLSLPNDAERHEIFSRFLITDQLAAANTNTDAAIEIINASSVYDFEELLKESKDMSAGDIKAAIKSIKQQRFMEGGDIESPITQSEVIEALRAQRRVREA